MQGALLIGNRSQKILPFDTNLNFSYDSSCLGDRKANVLLTLTMYGSLGIWSVDMIEYTTNMQGLASQDVHVCNQNDLCVYWANSRPCLGHDIFCRKRSLRFLYQEFRAGIVLRGIVLWAFPKRFTEVGV